MDLTALTALSPIDGRYREKIKPLVRFFSEFGWIHYRLQIEVYYFLHLCQLPLPPLKDLSPSQHQHLKQWLIDFDMHEAERIKAIEKETNHDIKALEYYMREKFVQMGLGHYVEFIHFGLTSQDINNTAVPLLLKEALAQVYWPALEALTKQLAELARRWAEVPMLARTHGQPASPTRLGKEIWVFVERIEQQMALASAIPFAAKFGGATGNFNAHQVAYPMIDWPRFADQMLDSLGLRRSQTTTQIEHYDHLAALLDNLRRLNTILIDLARDMWHYISIDYFKQKVVAGEVGSSAMPHKVNPIDFENAEGNLLMANALFVFLSEKLPVSRLQRDLTDSTVLRNLGIPLAHSLIAFQSLAKGLDKLDLQAERLSQDLDQNWGVIAEAIQTILRRENYPHPYEALKQLTRGQTHLNEQTFRSFISQLELPVAVKDELYALRPETYLGYPPKLT